MSSIRGHYDVISNLPDPVLCHILSFLPTKEAVATSVLSKRWTHLWHSVLDIDLTDENDVQGTNAIELDDEYTLFRFNEFVYSVLLKLDSIKSFRLIVGYDNSDLEKLGIPSVVKWVDHVVQHGVENLRLNLFTSMKLPVRVLNCKTLVTLNLFAFDVKGFSSVRLPSLKALRFNMCTLQHNRDLVLFLDGCPILEDLYLDMLEFLSEDSLTYQECESLSLSKLIKAQMSGVSCHFPMKALYNVDKLCIKINKVYRSFDEIRTFHNLTELTLNYINSNWNLLVEVLNNCPKLQNLQLCEAPSGCKRVHVQKYWVDPKLVPQCLSLHLKTCEFFYFLGQQGELMLTRYILKNARVLQTMIIYCYRGFKLETELSLWPRASPTCELIIENECT